MIFDCRYCGEPITGPPVEDHWSKPYARDAHARFCTVAHMDAYTETQAGR